MRHHFGGEQFHAAHHLHVRDHSAGIEPADYAPEVEFVSYALQALDACIRGIEDRHHFAGLLPGRAADPLDPLRHMCRRDFGPLNRRPIDAGHGLQVMIDARLHQLPDPGTALVHINWQGEGDILAAVVGMSTPHTSLPVNRQILPELRKGIGWRGDKDRMAHAAHVFECFDAARSGTDRRMRLLHRLGHHAEIVHFEEAAGM